MYFNYKKQHIILIEEKPTYFMTEKENCMNFTEDTFSFNNLSKRFYEKNLYFGFNTAISDLN